LKIWHLDHYAFPCYDFIKTCFSEVITLSEELIFARIAENNKDGIFSNLLVYMRAVIINLPKSEKRFAFRFLVTSFDDFGYGSDYHNWF